MQPYVPARGRAQAVDVLLAAQIALLVLRAAGWLYVTLVGHSELARVIARGASLSAPFMLVLFVGATVAFLAWLDRAARNLPALGASDAIEAEHVVGAFFVPMVNLVAAPWLVARVWLDSDPTPPPRARMRRLLGGWWATFLAGAAVSVMTLRPVAPGWLELESLLRLASALALLGIVRDIQRRQDAQWLDLEQQRAVPQPTAEALR